MAVQNILEQVINYEIFVEGERCIGTASCELPEINFKTQTISGAGIAGEIDAPSLGHIESLELKLTFRALFQKPVSLLEQKAVQFSLRGAVQQYEPTNGTLKPLPVRIDIRGRVKGISLGKFEPSELMDTEVTFDCDFVSVKVDGQELFLHDKLNFVNKVNGVDYLAQVRTALGL